MRWKGVSCSMFPFRFVAILLVVLACSGGGAAEVQRGSPIGFGDYITEGLPPDATNLIEIAASQVFTLGLRADGSVIGWGSSYNFGALSIPLDLPKVRQIAAGYYFGMALTEEGNVRVWGAWGHVFQTAIVTPPVEATNLVAIAGGMAHCFALRADGRVFAWGDHLSDALLVPAGLSNATSITAGQRFSLGITSAGQIVAWGNTEYYQQSAKPP